MQQSVSSLNDLYVDNFLSYIGKVLGYSEKTVVSYGHDLLRLTVFLNSRDIVCTDVSPEDTRVFALGLYEQKLSSATINRILSACRRFYRNLYENGQIKIQPFERISRAKQGRRVPTVLSEEELNKLLNAETNDYTSVMEVTMFNLFYSTGCRLSEITGMKISDIDIQERRILVNGKGSKQRFVFITDRCLKHLAEYINLRSALLSGINKETDILLINKKGNPLPLSSVHSIFDKYRIRLGFTKKFTPHVFRHTFATHLLNNRSDIRIVQALLGHENIGTTQIYTHVTDSQLEEVYRSAHPHGMSDNKKSSH